MEGASSSGSALFNGRHVSLGSTTALGLHPLRGLLSGVKQTSIGDASRLPVPNNGTLGCTRRWERWAERWLLDGPTTECNKFAKEVMAEIEREGER